MAPEICGKKMASARCFFVKETGFSRPSCLTLTVGIFARPAAEEGAFLPPRTSRPGPWFSSLRHFFSPSALPLRAALFSLCALAILAPAKLSAQTWTSPQLGNIFDEGQPVELTFTTEADSVPWKITDFWHKQVDSGTAAVSEGKAVIKPKVATVGYYLLNVDPTKAGAALPEAYTSFAIVRPHVSKDPLKSPFGAMTHFAQGMNPEMLPTLKRIGIESIRDEHYWAQVEEQKGVFKFSPKSDAYMAACKKAGIHPLIAMTFGNKLYDHNDGPSTPAGFEGYGNYGQAILRQYGDEIRWLEIWNEYNGTWAPPSARKDLESRYTTYTAMLKTAYDKIKAVRPDVQVLGGAAILIPLPFFEGIFKLGGLKSMDAIVIHPYRQEPEGVDTEIQELKALIKKYNDGKEIPIWVTETGRHTKDEYDWEKGKKMFEMGRAEGARYLARIYTLLLSEKVAKIYWYLSSDHMEFVSMGLLRNHAKEESGMGRYAVAPAYVSYANLIHQLDGAEFVRREPMPEYSRTHVHTYQRDGEEIRVAWATQPSKLRMKASGPLKVYNLMGAEVPVQAANGEIVFDLTEDAIYVIGKVEEVSEIDSGRRVIASSNDDYTKTQGGNNWYYGYYENGVFKELKQVETMWGYNWGGVGGFLAISPGDMHPEMNSPAVLRWKSPVDGKLTIKGHWENKGQGDGIIGVITVDGKELNSQQVGGSGKPRAEVNLPVEVQKDTIIDFVCKPGANTAYDATNREFMIIQED